MITAQSISPIGQKLAQDTVAETLSAGLEKRFTNQRVLVLIPDNTRSLPLPMLFRLLVTVLQDVKHLDFMIALGTHQPILEERLNALLGITAEERQTTFKHVGLLNHCWDDPEALTQVGVISEDQMRKIAGEYWHQSLEGDTPVRINKAVLEYDHLLILGPTFPHEVVGFSGGAKYLFPGISGPEMIHKSHWLGALVTVKDIIGIKDTPPRAMIHAGAEMVKTPITLIALIMVGHDLNGIIIGDYLTAWEEAVKHSSERNIRWYDQPFQKVLSCCPPMYDELWTGGKAMYKLEPVVAIDGELTIFAPHLDTLSVSHGKTILELGYHILPYFLTQWERFKQHPLGVIAHSTQLRGSGRMENGVEKPNVKLSLASKFSPEICTRLCLGYADPEKTNFSEWQDREDEGILFIPKAGEILYRLRQ